MKKMTTVMAMMVMVLMTAGNVAAEMVDIGMGQMERSKFEALKAVLQGHPIQGEKAVSTVRAKTENYGLLEMMPADFDALRDKVAGKEKNPTPCQTASVATPMVDIGTGEMPADDFVKLKRMVQDSEHIVFAKRLALQP
ncbi:MAG: hypothetical protein CR984_00435 [Proteobacteria bacterium]|nr:MAG: hypothetical protein CR984_00435 [Pseudomonadota bacterium]